MAPGEMGFTWSASDRRWLALMAEFERPSLRRALWQIFDTFVPYLALWALMICTVHYGYPYWVTLALSLLAAGFLVRMFILFHDCCHGSFFSAKWANGLLGTVAGVLTFTPYKAWRWEHNMHHATSGDLDRRGTGDINTLTVAEYRASPFFRRLAYRAYRNPLVMFGLGPAFIFLFNFRFWPKGGKRSERISVLVTDIALAGILLLASLTIGLKTYLAIQLPIILIGGAAGIWLFYVQHQFEKTYWAPHKIWNSMAAAIEGSSFYRLPKVFQWFSGNIGLHHVHHLRPRIPNYNLQRCYDAVTALHAVAPLTLLGSLRGLWLHLWDERQQKMVSFRALRHI